MSRIAYVNGSYVPRRHAAVSIEDRGYQFADGIYEVALIKNNVIIDAEGHFLRLAYSLGELSITQPMTDGALKLVIQQLLRRNRMRDAVLYLQVTRGTAKRDHPFPKGNVRPSVVMTLSPLKQPSAAQYETGVSAISHPDLRWGRRDIKSIALLPSVLAKQKAVEAGTAEAILHEADSTVTEGSATNVFIVNAKGHLQTHPKGPRILGGITREGILEVAKTEGVVIEEEPFSLEQLKGAGEVFISSTTKHILPITTLDGKALGSGKPGAVTKQLIAAYGRYIENQWRTK